MIGRFLKARAARKALAQRKADRPAYTARAKQGHQTRRKAELEHAAAKKREILG